MVMYDQASDYNKGQSLSIAGVCAPSTIHACGASERRKGVARGLGFIREMTAKNKKEQ